MTTQPVTDAALWYQDAVVYQLHIRAFCDSNGDGIGDFRGLTGKLDYVQDLGVTAIWLLPFYPSPLKDDGYDIADYTSVNPIYGTLADFERFLDEAHRRDIKVITELVMNHTSDQHPWFQRARRAKPGSRERDFYVWSSDPQKYRQARIIFQDFETSNWTWDHAAEAYFWHRFYSHQPDLNFDNPAVHEAMKEVLDFWLSRGVDGVRLDAVPYLYEREGTNCENLSETHAFLQEIRRHVDIHYENRMILAEANQWPEDAAAYFGEGNECHMNFHFPLMPRLFMAVQREDRFPVLDILAQTPALPPGCQWAIFLRNHDELTLEMVTDEERDYMYRAYADDPQARINLGIRRRLAPLLKKNRRKIELMSGLLLSLPGTPIIYYGDEIGMGDNIYLGDRDSVRTPMQWSPDRNAGFSRANPQRLFLPPVIDSEYHYESVNVETEQNSPHSLLWWMRSLIRLRRQHRVFGRGTIEFLTPDNAKVLVFVREDEEESILVVANLSRFAQYVELDLSRFRGRAPVEMFGQSRFPMIGELPYFLTVGPHSFMWFSLLWPEGEKVRYSPEELPSLSVSGEWANVFSGKTRGRLEAILPDYLKKHRWYGGKSRTIQQTSVADAIHLPAGEEETPVRLVLVQVDYTDGEPDNYLLPLTFAVGRQAENILHDRPTAGVAALNVDGEAGFLCDATAERDFWQRLLALIAERGGLSGTSGEVAPVTTNALAELRGDAEVPLEVTVHGGQQSNTSAIFGQRLIMKIYRRVGEGVNPELEIGRFLTEQADFPHTPLLGGALEYKTAAAEPKTLAIVQEFRQSAGDAWTSTLDEIGRYLEEVAAGDRPLPDVEALSRRSLLELARRRRVAEGGDVVGTYLQAAELLGRRTAEMHASLASGKGKHFEPEEFSTHYQRSLYQSMRSQAVQSFALLRKQSGRLPEAAREEAGRVLACEESVLARFRAVTERKITARRIRVHGDYHLGQVLFTGKDFVIIDFEGEPDRPIGERRIKRSPLRDVAGMIRSFHYASSAALAGELPGVAVETLHAEGARRWLEYWYFTIASAYLRAYLSEMAESEVLPGDDEELAVLLDAYMLEKLVYELKYELNNRPDWVRIPLAGILQVGG